MCPPPHWPRDPDVHRHGRVSARSRSAGSGDCQQSGRALGLTVWQGWIRHRGHSKRPCPPPPPPHFHLWSPPPPPAPPSPTPQGSPQHSLLILILLDSPDADPEELKLDGQCLDEANCNFQLLAVVLGSVGCAGPDNVKPWHRMVDSLARQPYIPACLHRAFEFILSSATSPGTLWERGSGMRNNILLVGKGEGSLKLCTCTLQCVD